MGDFEVVCGKVVGQEKDKILGARSWCAGIRGGTMDLGGADKGGRGRGGRGEKEEDHDKEEAEEEEKKKRRLGSADISRVRRTPIPGKKGRTGKGH